MPTTFAHVNLIARDWRRLVRFYSDVFGCEAILPERDLWGEWLDHAVGITDARIRGIHMRLPGVGERGPTLEIFQYESIPEFSESMPDHPGFSHIAFAVDDVAACARAVEEHGGSAVGMLTRRILSGVGTIQFQYLRDPEGNIIEVQQWERKDG